MRKFTSILFFGALFVGQAASMNENRIDVDDENLNLQEVNMLDESELPENPYDSPDEYELPDPFERVDRAEHPNIHVQFFRAVCRGDVDEARRLKSSGADPYSNFHDNGARHLENYVRRKCETRSSSVWDTLLEIVTD